MEELPPSSSRSSFISHADRSCVPYSLGSCWGLPGFFRSNPRKPLPSLPLPQQKPTVSTDPSPRRPYAVFLNHRGPDVKKSLASSIYHWLEDKGLRVFLDKEEFQAGDGLHPTIQQAISTSSAHVAIFSKRYAESSWCLDELCSMLKSGAKIIPVFCDDVRPSDLRWIGKGKGIYAKAFSQHQRKRRFLSQRVDQWKAALEQVSYLYGLELHGAEFQGDCGKLLKSIADAVLEAVAEKTPQESPKDAVGLDEAVGDFQKFLQGESQQSTHEAVKIVGIAGIGGSGKTTLAKQFYNIQRASFSASSFLSDVRHAAAQQKLQSLQSKLLKDLLHIHNRNIERGSVSDGRVILTNRLQSSTPCVLIVLDDIDHEDQVENLLDKEALGSGSLILVISRDKDRLIKSRADCIYEMKPLNKNHAQELFCRHAFEQPRPKMGFEDLVEKFCGKCRGLPLFLKVMGAHLRVIGNDDKDVWKIELEYIPDDIRNILQISYNALRKEDQQIFLDVACFFLGQNKSSAISVWNRSEGRGWARLKNLENKCLVEVDNENRLKMHDYLRDFGREIAEEEPQCRFWHSHKIINIREELKGRREVRGIIAASSVFSPESALQSAFAEIELSSLRFLGIKGDCFETRFGQRATNLMWLRWFDFPHRSIPSWLISMENLTVLELRSKRLEEWPVCNKQLPLKELIIESTRLPKISFPEAVWPHLEHLNLCGNGSLIEVEHLPTALLVLNLDGCIMLKRISGSFHLPRLEKLSICGCFGLCNLPNLSGLTSLETLDVDGCYGLSCIKGLEQLRKLKNLSISECSVLRGLPNLSGLTSLETLHADGCTQLESIEGLQHLRKLRKLSIRLCCRLRELSNLSALTSLQSLEAHGCPRLQNIQGLEHLHKLKNLNISLCSELQSLPNLSGLSSLETLDARDCIRLQKMRGAEHLRKFRHLKLRGCRELDELPNLSGLTSLETLEAEGCWKLQSIDGLDQLERLTLLALSAADGNRAILKSIQQMKKLPARLMFSAVGGGSNALSFPGFPVSEFSYSRELGRWKSEMHAWTDGMPCTSLIVCGAFSHGSTCCI